MFTLIGLAMVVLSGAAQAPGLTTIAQGFDSRISERTEIVVRAQDEWLGLWQAHSSQPAPPVDFSRSVVVGVFLGSRPTAGYQVEITAIATDGGVTMVDYVERRPARGSLVAQVLTAPFHLVSVDGLAEDVRFRRVTLN